MTPGEDKCEPILGYESERRDEDRPFQEPVRNSVDHPAHYNAGKFEVIDVIEDWDLCFNAGNVVKYIARAKHKGKELEDLRKARWYLDRLIANLENE